MVKIDYGVDIDMNDNQILNVAVQTLNALPATGVTGKLIYYTVDNTLRYWNGSAWDPLGGDVDLSNYVTNTSLSTTLSSYAKKYKGTITGDGSTKSFTITHSIGSMPVVQVFDSSGVFVVTKVTSGSSTAVVEFNTAPGSGVTYSVICVG